ncbi:hypothetical protein HY469_04020 [Candidatus Roizmanbacteria bacterium]|nr:hypothetical protein [Candidatus Roizmanbacteria bacterium]
MEASGTAEIETKGTDNIIIVEPTISSREEITAFMKKYEGAPMTMFDSPDENRRMIIFEKGEGKTQSRGVNSCFSIVAMGSQELTINSHSPIKYARADAERIRNVLEERDSIEGITIYVAGNAPFSAYDHESDVMWQEVARPFIEFARKNSTRVTLMLLRLDGPTKTVSFGIDKTTHGADIDYVITDYSTRNAR